MKASDIALTRENDATLLTFVAPGAGVPSINTVNGKHWTTWRKNHDAWFLPVRRRLLEARLAGEVDHLRGRKLRVEMHVDFFTKRRRDPHNYTGTVVKWVVDAIVQSGIIPDDTPDWIEVVDPVFGQLGYRAAPLVRFTLTPVGDPR